MPRPVRCRRIEHMPVYRSFSPDDVTAVENLLMTVDEYEAFRLLDEEGLTQEACANRMNVSRTTVTAIYDSARKNLRRWRGCSECWMPRFSLCLPRTEWTGR